MTPTAFDEQLRHTFETLAERLRQETSAQLDAALAGLSEAAGNERDKAVADAANNAWATAERQVSERLTASLAAAEARARADAEASEMDATGRLVDAIRAIDAAGTLSDVLEVLAARAGLEASRTAIFVPEGNRLRGWRFVGFDGLTADGADLELSLDAAGILADALETGQPARAGDPAWSGSSRAVAPEPAALPPDRPALAVPLVMGGEVFALLYADHGAAGDIARQPWPATIEVLARHAARSLEAVTAVRLTQLSDGRA
jgi:GAF domain